MLRFLVMGSATWAQVESEAETEVREFSEELTVTGTREERKLSEVPVAIGIVDKSDLEAGRADESYASWLTVNDLAGEFFLPAKPRNFSVGSDTRF